MGPTLRLRIAGLPLRLSLLSPLVFVITLVGIVCLEVDSASTRLLVALGSGLLIVVGYALHDLARVLSYRRCGVRVRRLDLTLFGAVPYVEERTLSLRAECMAGGIALVVIVIFALALWASTTVTAPGSAVHHLFRTSLLATGGVAAIQSSPALPCDGGRIVRAWLWQVTEDSVKANLLPRIYAAVLSISLVIAGVFFAMEPGQLPYWGLAIGTSGLTLAVATREHARDSRAQSRAATMRLGDLTLGWSRRIPAESTLESAAVAVIAEGSGPPLLVIRDHQPAGLLQQHHLRGVRRSQWHERKIADVMTPLTLLPVFTADANALDVLLALDDHEWVVLTDESGSIRFVDRSRLIDHIFVEGVV